MEDSKAIRLCHCVVTPGRCWKLHLCTPRLVEVSPQMCFLLLSPLLFSPFIGLMFVTPHWWNMLFFFLGKYFKVQIMIDYYCFETTKHKRCCRVFNDVTRFCKAQGLLPRLQTSTREIPRAIPSRCLKGLHSKDTCYIYSVYCSYIWRYN